MPSMLDFLPWGGPRNDRNPSDVERGSIQTSNSGTIEHPLQDLMDIDAAARVQNKATAGRATSVIPLQLDNIRDGGSGSSISPASAPPRPISQFPLGKHQEMIRSVQKRRHNHEVVNADALTNRQSVDERGIRTVVRTVNPPTELLQQQEIDRLRREVRQALEEEHCNIVDKMKEEFDATTEHYKKEIAALKTGAQMTEDQTIEDMRKELDQAKLDKEQAQEESQEFRGMLSALRKEVNDMKANNDSTSRTSESEDMPQGKTQSDELAAIKLQLEGFSAAMDEAKRTTKELRHQLKTTQQQASKAEAENQASRQTIDILEAQVQQEKKRNKALGEVPGRAYATRGGEEENSNDDTEMGTDTDVNQTSSNNKRNEDMVGDESRDMYEDEDADVDMDSDMLKSKAGKARPHRNEPQEGTPRTMPRPQVPPPQKVASPRGGQGLPAKTVPRQPSRSRRSEHPDRSKRKKYDSANIDALFMDSDNADLCDSNGDDDEDKDEGQARAEGRKGQDSKRLDVYANPKLRGNNPRRAKKLGLVRVLMNRIMGMEKDEDIINADLAQSDEVEIFENDQSNSPEGFCPYLGKRFEETAWHLHFEEEFVDQFEKVHKVRLEEKGRDSVAILYRNRLGRLQVNLNRQMKAMPEGERDARRRKVASRGRRNVQRVNDWDFRRIVCLENIETPDGDRDPFWAATLEMVQCLGPAGMSSDDSDIQDNKPIYFVRKRLWRSQEVTERLKHIESHRNTTNGVGKARLGNPYRERIRSAKNPASTRDPKIKCPENFYDRGFLKGLDNIHYRALKMSKHFDLEHTYAN